MGSSVRGHDMSDGKLMRPSLLALTALGARSMCRSSRMRSSVGARGAESGFGLIPGFRFPGPLEELALKGG
jgi:hypothetical protein